MVSGLLRARLPDLATSGRSWSVRRQPRSWSNRGNARALVKLAGGFVVPLGIFSLYLLPRAQWRLHDTVAFNATYVPRRRAAVYRWANVINRAANSDRWLFLVAAIGFAVWASGLLLHLFGRVVPTGSDQVRSPVTMSVPAYSSINFAGWGDFLPFVPWVAIWSGWLLHGMRKLGQLRLRAPFWPTVVPLDMVTTLVDQTASGAQPSLRLAARARQTDRAVRAAHTAIVYVLNSMEWFALLSNHRRRNTTMPGRRPRFVDRSVREL
jgi:hypothetical protein